MRGKRKLRGEKAEKKWITNVMGMIVHHLLVSLAQAQSEINQVSEGACCAGETCCITAG